MSNDVPPYFSTTPFFRNNLSLSSISRKVPILCTYKSCMCNSNDFITQNVERISVEDFFS